MSLRENLGEVFFNVFVLFPNGWIVDRLLPLLGTRASRLPRLALYITGDLHLLIDKLFLMEDALDQLKVLFLPLVLLLQLYFEFLNLLILDVILVGKIHYYLAWHQRRVSLVNPIKNFLDSV